MRKVLESFLIETKPSVVAVYQCTKDHKTFSADIYFCVRILLTLNANINTGLVCGSVFIHLSNQFLTHFFTFVLLPYYDMLQVSTVSYQHQNHQSPYMDTNPMLDAIQKRKKKRRKDIYNNKSFSNIMRV